MSGEVLGATYYFVPLDNDEEGKDDNDDDEDDDITVGDASLRRLRIHSIRVTTWRASSGFSFGTACSGSVQLCDARSCGPKERVS